MPRTAPSSAPSRRPATSAQARQPADPTTVRLTLADPCAGQHVTVKMDRVRRKHLRAIEEAEPAKQTLVLFDLIELVATVWDIRDAETNAPLPQPVDGGVDELTAGQMLAIYAALNAYNEAATNVPKA